MLANFARFVVSSFVLAAASLTGQVFVHVVPVGAVTASTSVQGVPATVSQPGGGIVDVAAQSVGSPLTAAASFQWFAQSNALWPDIDSRFEFSFALAVAVPNASAALPQTELLVELRAPAPTPVWLNVQRLVDLVGTSQLPLWEVDVGDDGTVDYSAPLSTSGPTSLVVGIAPTYVRVRVGAILAQPGQIDLWFRLLLTPRAGVTRLEAQPGCGAEMLVLPTFGNSGRSSVSALGRRRKVITALADAGSSKAAKGSGCNRPCRWAADRTKVAKLRPSPASIAFSQRRSNTANEAGRASNTTLPLDSSVRTPEKPAASKQAFSSGMRAFIGLTPRRKAT